ncbi:MAG: hypothetical protein O3A36_03635 [bacterium]|nr:hypothetical protein [bacterium]
MQFPFETLQGILAGIIFALGAILITRIPKYRWHAASIFILVTTPLALLPFWFSYGDLGISDWDYYFSMHTNIRDSIVQHKQFPLWNPYTCGGTSALGDPEFPALSPLFLMELVFGTPNGLRLSIFASTAIGALGMLHLARKLGIGVLGGLIASLPMSLGTVNLIEIVEGHPNILAAMYIPWVLYFWYSAYLHAGKARTQATIIIAILLALMFFQGGIYLLMYMTGVFIILPFLVRQKIHALKVTCIAGILALGLASIKLVPAALWLQQFQDKAYASSAFTLLNLDDIFLGRILHGAEDVIANQGGGWHEYGAYIGPVILVLACIGAYATKKNRITKALLFCAITTTLVSSLGPYLKPFFDQASFIPRSNISRVVLLAVIPISLLAGYGIHSIQKKSRIMYILAFVLCALAAVDIMSLAYPLASQAFVLPRVQKVIPQAPYPIAYSPFDYKIRHNEIDYTRAYEATLAGYGTMSYCSVLSPERGVKIITDESNINILEFSDDKAATFKLLDWSPNKVIAHISTTQKTSVSLNANYAKGWHVNGMPAKEIANRPATELEAGDTAVTFSYIPPGMWVGLAISIVTIVGILIALAVPLSPIGERAPRPQAGG